MRSQVCLNKKVYKYTHSIFNMAKKRGQLNNVKNFLKFKHRCFWCKNLVDISVDNSVHVATLNRATKPDDHCFFHFQCWANWLNEMITKKSQEKIDETQQQVVKIFNDPMIAKLLNQIEGSQIALNMLKTPLNKIISK